MEERVENQEIYCHECGRYVQFPIDLSMSGNHILKCPNCGHEHCRVVKDGIITDDRWDSRNNSYYVSPRVITSSATSASTNDFIFHSWGTASASSTAIYSIATS